MSSNALLRKYSGMFRERAFEYDMVLNLFWPMSFSLTYFKASDTMNIINFGGIYL